MSATSSAPAPQGVHAGDNSISRHIADFAVATSYESIPDRIRERARLHMLDVIGTALAATRHEFSHRALGGLRAVGETGSHTVIGMRVKLPLRDAALLTLRLCRHDAGELAAAIAG